MSRFLYLLVTMLLASCATGYHSPSYSGGYTDKILGDGYYSVNFSANGYTSKQRAEDLALLRACELARSGNYKRFDLIGGHTNINAQTTYTSGTTNTFVNGNSYGGNFQASAFSITTPPIPITSHKPDSTVTIHAHSIPERGNEIEAMIQKLATKYRIRLK